MKLSSTAAIVLSASLFTVGVPQNIQAARKNAAGYALEWHSSRQSYVYVFSGIVSRRGKPCPSARIQLQLSLSSQPDVFRETQAAEDGSYEMTVSVTGDPEQSAEWKLIAQAAEGGVVQASEIGGRTILTGNGDAVVVQRRIQLIEG